jgi:hypothetical protein
LWLEVYALFVNFDNMYEEMNWYVCKTKFGLVDEGKVVVCVGWQSA